MGTWSLAIPTTPPFAYTSLAEPAACISDNGQIAYMGQRRIWKTTDAGLTWTEMTPTGSSTDRQWDGLSCSSDGQTVLASDTSPGRLWLSTNGGTSWTEVRPNGNADFSWGPNAMASNGSVLYASMNNSAPPTNHVRLYKSTDGGGTWTDVAAAATWTYAVGPAVHLTGVRSSNDGTVVYCSEQLSGVNGGRLRISTDSGATWTELQPEGNVGIAWGDSSAYGVCIAMDSTGTKLLAASHPSLGHGGYLHYSSNQGSSWTTLTPNGAGAQNYHGVGMSKDASWFLVLDNTGFVFWGSHDQGATWVDQQMLFPEPDSADSFGTIAINNVGTFALTDGDTGNPDYNDAVLFFRTPLPPPSLVDDLNSFADALSVQSFTYSRHTLLWSMDQMVLHGWYWIREITEGKHGWYYDVYTPNIIVHYGEEGAGQHSVLCGGEDGMIYQMTGDSDNGVPVSCEILTGCHDQGDPRFNKLYGDVMVDCNTGGVNVTATTSFNNDAIVSPSVVLNNIGRDQLAVPVGSAWQTARNVAIDLKWQMNGSRSFFYIWEPRFTEEGGKVFAFSWETCWLSHGLPGFFYHGYIYIVHISTADLTLSIINEDQTVAASVTIPNSGGNHHKDFIRLPVVKGKLFKYTLSSTAEFRVEGQESELLLREWGGKGPWKRARIFQDAPQGRTA